MSTLLENAKSQPAYGKTKPTVSDEEFELVMAYINLEVTLSQVAKSQSIGASTAQNKLHASILASIRSGRLVPKL